MYFMTPKKEDMEAVRSWRNSSKQSMMLRTAFNLTQEMQEDFYTEKVSNRNSNCRFWSVYSQAQKKSKSTLGELIGFVGLENIQWENRCAEISLITNPKHHEKMSEMFATLMEIAFMKLNLKSIFTEVYGCSPYRDIWRGIAKTHGAFVANIPFRKFYKGEYYNSAIYTFALSEVPENGDTSIESTCALN